VRRWALGFWQTVRLHRPFGPGLFWWSLRCYCVELVLSSMLLLATAALILSWLILAALGAVGVDAGWPAPLPSVLSLLLVVLAPDLLITLAVAAGQRRLGILAAAPVYPLLRLVDAWLCLAGLLGSFRTVSTGRWSSPTRRTTTAVAGCGCGALPSSGT
jgi:hypothetical protein